MGMGSMRPTKGDEILEAELAHGAKSAKDVLKRFAENSQVVNRVQKAMDESDALGPKPGNVKHQAIRTALVELLADEFVS